MYELAEPIPWIIVHYVQNIQTNILAYNDDKFKLKDTFSFVMQVKQNACQKVT